MEAGVRFCGRHAAVSTEANSTPSSSSLAAWCRCCSSPGAPASTAEQVRPGRLIPKSRPAAPRRPSCRAGRTVRVPWAVSRPAVFSRSAGRVRRPERPRPRYYAQTIHFEGQVRQDGCFRLRLGIVVAACSWRQRCRPGKTSATTTVQRRLPRPRAGGRAEQQPLRRSLLAAAGGEASPVPAVYTCTCRRPRTRGGRSAINLTRPNWWRSN